MTMPYLYLTLYLLHHGGVDWLGHEGMGMGHLRWVLAGGGLHLNRHLLELVRLLTLGRGLVLQLVNGLRLGLLLPLKLLGLHVPLELRLLLIDLLLLWLILLMLPCLLLRHLSILLLLHHHRLDVLIHVDRHVRVCVQLRLAGICVT